MFLRVRGARALLPAGGGVFRTRSVRSPYVDLKKKQDELVSRKRRNKGGGAPLSEEEERIASAAPYPSVWDDAAETSEWKEITRWNSSDLFIPVSTAGRAYAFAREGRSVLVLTSANASAVRLVQLSASTGKLEKVLAAGEKGKGEFCFCFFLLRCASVVELPRSLHARSLAPALQPLETAQRGTFISSAAKAQEKNKNRKISPPLLSPSLSPPLITRPLFLSSKINKKQKDEDVVATAFDAVSGELVAFATERLRRKWQTTAKAWDPDAALVNRALNGSDEFSVASKASDNSRVILRFVSDTQPPTYYLLDRRDKRNRTVTKQITVNSFSEKSFLFSFSRPLFSPSFSCSLFSLTFPSSSKP